MASFSQTSYWSCALPSPLPGKEWGTNMTKQSAVERKSQKQWKKREVLWGFQEFAHFEKAWKLNAIINQCKVHTSQYYLVSFHVEYRFCKEKLAQSPCSWLQFLEMFQKWCKALRVMEDRSKSTTFLHFKFQDQIMIRPSLATELYRSMQIKLSILC